MGVSINGGTAKWMVYFMENPVKMDDLGVPP
jgi:ribosome-associated protein YbcJ (S4-like RNA binding protein)